jgi:hypothetical protein
LVESSVSEALPDVPVSRRGDPKTAVAVGATQAEISASVLDMQAGPTRTTLESDGGLRPGGLPVTPPSPGSFDRATVGGSAEPVTVPLAVPQAGTVIEPPSVVGANPPPPQQPFGQPPPPQQVPPQQPFGQPQFGQPASGLPSVAPKSKTPLIAAAAAAGVLLLGGIGIAVARSGDSKAATTTTTTAAAAPVGGGSPISTASTSSTSALPVTLKPVTTTSTAPATTAPPAPPSTAAPVASGDRALNVEQADSTLLTVDEVASAAGGSGWTEGVWTPGGDLCGVAAPDAILDRHSVAVRNEVAGANIGVIVSTSTLTYATLSDLNENYSSLKRISNDCPDPSLNENGVTGTITFIPAKEINIPNLDRAMLLGLTAQVDGVSIPNQILLVIATRGRSSFAIQYQINGRAGIDEDAVALQKLYLALAEKFVAALP